MPVVPIRAWQRCILTQLAVGCLVASLCVCGASSLQGRGSAWRDVPQLAMLLHNDFLYIGHRLLTLSFEVRWPSANPCASLLELKPVVAVLSSSRALLVRRCCTSRDSGARGAQSSMDRTLRTWSLPGITCCTVCMFHHHALQLRPRMPQHLRSNVLFVDMAPFLWEEAGNIAEGIGAKYRHQLMEVFHPPLFLFGASNLEAHTLHCTVLSIQCTI